MKKTVLLALFVAPLLLVSLTRSASADDKVWSLSSNTRAADCAYCHGEKGEGGMGPDLAGRKLTLAQYKKAITKPWGIMPAYPNLSDQTIQALWEYLTNLPPVPEAAPARALEPPANAPHGQRETVVYGCAMCHGVEMARPRTTWGGKAIDWNWSTFEKIVYDHTSMYPRNMMGIFSRDRVPEEAARAIYDFINEVGLRVPVTANIVPDAATGGNATYTLTVQNGGQDGKGLTAEDITVSLDIPAGAKVVSTTGPGYVGVSRNAENNADMAVWKFARLAPTEKQEFKLTLSGTDAASAMFKQSMVSWLKPEPKYLPNQVKDPSLEKQIPVAKGDGVFVVLRKPAPAQAQAR